MKIAINGSFWAMHSTGSGQYTHQLVEGLWRDFREDPVDLVVPEQVSQEHETALSARRFRVVTTPFDHIHSDLAKVWFEQRALPRACKQHSYDVLHVPYFAPPQRPTVPTVVTIHDLIPLLLPEYRGSRAVQLYTAMVAKAAARADLVLTDSLASKRDIVDRLAISQERVRVVYLAADEQFAPLSPNAKAATRERLGLPSEYLLYLGGFDTRKNVLGLIWAYHRAAMALDLPLIVAGGVPDQDTPFAPDPRILANELQLSDRIRFIGWVPEQDKHAIFACARAFCFPSRYEGFGLPVLESISCGTPAIIGAGSSLEEVGGPGALPVTPDDIDALADAMVRLCEDDSLRTDLSEAGLKHARTFSWKRTVRETHQAYYDVQ